MPTPGLLMRLIQPLEGKTPSNEEWAPSNVGPNIDAIYRAQRTDDQSPEYNAMYFLSDISPLLKDDSFYEKDRDNSKTTLKSIAWVLASYINGEPFPDSNAPPTTPPLATEIVINGSTPKPEYEADYNNWYDQEHVGKLGAVPGWQLMRRYKFEKVYGEVETAGFYGINFYDEKNGLGGPEWQAGVTEWTLRIREQAAKPNVRRTWKLVGV
ncbi:3-oxoadipate enol-lactonase [Diaporthe helianthi]|uniref:3-oxoadipate enol-lactonase n=1 Tax=Diaporthe helianthi TaxID=158607 RepID=A0A2P5I3G7_DIAHE|nr:3-oxoadipate enol-lactonase [Diaporthe helianthi]